MAMLRGGIIGFGRMGVTHYSILNTHPEVDLVAVCDSSKFTLKNLKRYTSLELFTDYLKMFNSVKMDFVIIATPTASHHEIIAAAIEKNIHVFVEKPFVLSADQGSILTDKMQDKKLVNQVGYFLRFNEIFKAIKNIIDKGMIGNIVHYKNEMYGRTVLKPSRSSWRSKKEMGGGCILDFASHCIDFTDYLFGKANRVSGSLLKSIHSENVEDAVYTTLEHERDVSGSIMVNWSDETYRRPYNRIEILGKEGKIIADRQEYRLYLRNEYNNGQHFDEGWNVRYLPELDKGVRYTLRGSEFTNQLDYFIDSIKQDRTDGMCRFEDALRTDRVIDNIKQDFISRSN